MIHRCWRASSSGYALSFSVSSSASCRRDRFGLRGREKPFVNGRLSFCGMLGSSLAWDIVAYVDVELRVESFSTLAVPTLSPQIMSIACPRLWDIRRIFSSGNGKNMVWGEGFCM